MDRKGAIREFIMANIPDRELSDEDDIFRQGLVNSMFVVQLVVFVEKEFDISVGGDDLDFDNFRSVTAVDALVTRLSAG